MMPNRMSVVPREPARGARTFAWGPEAEPLRDIARDVCVQRCASRALLGPKALHDDIDMDGSSVLKHQCHRKMLTFDKRLLKPH